MRRAARSAQADAEHDARTPPERQATSRARGTTTPGRCAHRCRSWRTTPRALPPSTTTRGFNSLRTHSGRPRSAGQPTRKVTGCSVNLRRS
eukprot:799292-Prymnesium_polylepis.1